MPNQGIGANGEPTHLLWWKPLEGRVFRYVRSLRRRRGKLRKTAVSEHIYQPSVGARFISPPRTGLSQSVVRESDWAESLAQSLIVEWEGKRFPTFFSLAGMTMELTGCTGLQS